MHFDDLLTEIETHTETYRRRSSSVKFLEHDFCFFFSESIAIIMKFDDDGISFFPADYSDFWSMYGYKFDSILEYIREYLRELDLIQRHIPEIIDIYMEIYFFVHAHLYRYDLGEPLGELYTCSKE